MTEIHSVSLTVNGKEYTRQVDAGCCSAISCAMSSA